MNRHLVSLIVALGLGFAARAQTPPPADAPPPDDVAAWDEPSPGDAPRLPDGPPPDGITPPGEPDHGPARPDGGPPTQQFLDMLRNRNPEEFERMRRLREEDPEAFREELRNRIRRERERMGRDAGPDEGPAWRRGGQELRERIGRQVVEGGVRHAMSSESLRSPELDQLERKAGDLARAVREAPDDAAKAKARSDLRAALASSFDLREKMRRERFKHMEAQVTKVREMLDTRQVHRDEIIDKRLQSMTEGDALAW